MTAKEIRDVYRESLENIRKCKENRRINQGIAALTALMLGELAAQVAEFNENTQPNYSPKLD